MRIRPSPTASRPRPTPLVVGKPVYASVALPEDEDGLDDPKVEAPLLDPVPVPEPVPPVPEALLGLAVVVEVVDDEPLDAVVVVVLEPVVVAVVVVVVDWFPGSGVVAVHVKAVGSDVEARNVTPAFQ